MPSLDDAAVPRVAELLAMADARRMDTLLVDRGLTADAPLVRAQAALAVGQLAMSSRRERLHVLLADADSGVAANAAFSLGLLRDTSAIALLATALAGSSPIVEAAAWSLGEIGEAARTALERVLREGRPAAALPSLLTAAAKLQPVPAHLVTPYLAHANPGTVRAAAYALTRSRVPAGVRALVTYGERIRSETHRESDRGSAARRSAIDTRAHLARGLAPTVTGDSLGPRAFQLLVGLTRDPHPHVRINALRSIASFGADAKPILLSAATDRDANTRIAMVQALAPDHRLTRQEWETLWEADTGLTYRRAVLVGAARSAVILAALEPDHASTWHRHPDWRFRAAAIDAVGAAGLRHAEPVAGHLLRDPDPRVRAAAIGTLGRWADSAGSAGKPWSRPALRAVLSDADPVVRARVLAALRPRARAVDVRTAIDGWRRAIPDADNDARLAALRLIGAAWNADSASFDAPLRRAIDSLAPPASLVERAAVRGLTPFAHWPQGSGTARHQKWYEQQVREYVRPSLAGRPRRATIVTQRGTIGLTLLGAHAPVTVANFADLARRGYYDDLAFHRVVPNFVAQDGDPRGDGSGGPGYAIRDELNRHFYDRGVVGMALSGPDTGGSQYFIAHSPQPHLDGHYTAFARVTAGLEVLDALVQGDRIVRVTIQ